MRPRAQLRLTEQEPQDCARESSVTHGNWDCMGRTVMLGLPIPGMGVFMPQKLVNAGNWCLPPPHLPAPTHTHRQVC